MRDVIRLRNEIADELKENNLHATRSAMKPLNDIDFTKLLEIFDHEEAFLRQKFFTNLVRAHEARTGTDPNTKVNSHDVRTALLMLGESVKSAPDEIFSNKSKSLIVDVCPYCTD